MLNSVQKLLKRVMLADREREDAAVGGLYTTSIASDPLTQFSIVLSALIHDVDHSGELLRITRMIMISLPLIEKSHLPLPVHRSAKWSVDQGGGACCNLVQQQVGCRAKFS